MSTTNNEAKYGWIPDLPDNRDFFYAAPMHVVRTLPSSIDLRDICPPVVNQETLGSCTANAAGSAFHLQQMKQGIEGFPASRLFIYYNTRKAQGTLGYDSGASIRETIKTMNLLGVCAEERWPYVIHDFTKRPVSECYDKALTNQILQYNRIDNSSLYQLKGCLADGYPFVFGFSVKESFNDIGKDGIMPIPAPSERILGGHAVMAVGYDDARQVFIIRNSWSEDWGDKGYFYMPYAFITDTNNAADFWTIRMVEQGLRMVNA